MPIARLTLKSASPYTQSRKHDDEHLPSEKGSAGADMYDERTWRSKLHVEKGSIVIPAFAIKMALTDGAKYSKEQIPGQGKATWTAKFTSGIAIYDNPPLGLSPDAVRKITISANTDGQRGSGKRVPRRFPQIPEWQAVVEIEVLDPIITEDVLVRMANLAGKYIGIGQYRPQNGGTNGRFRVVGCEWTEE